MIIVFNTIGMCMSARIKLEGQRFGRWVVGEFRGANELKQTIYSCRCDCGTERDVVAQTLRNGLTLSCGCMKGQAIAVARTKHGHSRDRTTGRVDSRTYRIWQAMHNRCRGGTESGRLYYVSKGITVCERWSDFRNFLADMGEAPDGMSIDRWPNGKGNYEPGNCRWATAKEQVDNRDITYTPEGTVWVKSGSVGRRVSPELAREMVTEGWEYGRIYSRRAS